MPLSHGRTVGGIKAAMHKNISRELKAGQTFKQAQKTALGVAAEDASKARIKPSSLKLGQPPRRHQRK